MNKLGGKIIVGGKIVKNRVMMPPLVCFNWGDVNGYETVDRSLHYGSRARGGAGIIVVEATAVSKEARITRSELGLWEDGHMDQFKRIGVSCQEHQSICLVQLVHAGIKSCDDLVYTSSVKHVEGKEVKALSLDEIQIIKADFVSAAVRAYKAGLDGVEVHGAHGYLLSQFTSPVTNRREDIYGGDLGGRTRLACEIIKEIRLATDEAFIIGYRLGVNDHTFKEDIEFARHLEQLGVDLLNVSSGILTGEVEKAKDYRFSSITYMGKVIKDHVNIPVASVFGIRDAADAIDLVTEGLTDIVAVGRGILADPDWGNKAIEGGTIKRCYHCKPRCHFAFDGHDCPQNAQKDTL